MERGIVFITWLKEIPLIEYIMLGLLIIFFVFNNFIDIVQLENILATYFSESRINLIGNSAFILIGVYATITSVFGTSKTAATSRLVERDLNIKFIIYITIAIVSALILGIYVLFFLSFINVFILTFLITWMFLSLFRFLYIIILMYNFNVNTAKEIEEIENEKHNDIINVLTEISIDIKKNINGGKFK